MLKKIDLIYKGKKIFLNVKRKNFLGKIIGLMFSRREKANILLFSFRKEQNLKIHSFFVFYPFIALWLDKENRVIDFKIVKPFTPAISTKKYFYSLLEIPINKKNKKIISIIVDNKKFKKIPYYNSL